MDASIASATATQPSQSLSKSLQSVLSGYDFLKLFTSELQYQDPMQTMSNSDLMSQVGQMTNIQMVNDMTSKLGAIFQNGGLLQASGMIGKSVQYALPDGSTGNGIVQNVQVDAKGGIALGLQSGGLLSLDTIRQIM